MSAVLCGKRSFFEDLPNTPSPVISFKRIRSSSSPVRFPSVVKFAVSPSRSLLIDHLVSLFPDMDKQVLERALERCGDDLDSAIKSLHELRLGSVDANLCSNGSIVAEANGPFQSHGLADNGELISTDDISAQINHTMDGGDWVELFVKEMTSASDMDDARIRASRALEQLEKSIISRAGAETAQCLRQENMTLRGQVEGLIQENTLLKRAVAIQHERQKEFEDRNQEVHDLKQMVSQYQDQLRTLEVNNYALSMHLRQAQQNSSIPGRYNPDIF